jgi:hypothetical protein
VKLLLVVALLAACGKQAGDGGEARDRAIDAYYESTIKPTIRDVETEPSRLAGRVLPIAELRPDSKHPYGNGWGLDADLYRRFDPAIRIDRLEGADTIVAVYPDTALFAGPGQVTQIATAPTGAWVILFDAKTRKPTGRMLVQLTTFSNPATREQLDSERDRLAGTIAAHLQALPR